MGKIAFLFSGQGAQYSGMGKSLYEASAAAKAVFATAEQIRPGTMQQCFEGALEEISITKNTQPCLFCVDLAAAEALRATDDTVLAVAERTGFRNLSYFNRAFKARFGMTPKEYRRR